MIQEIPTERGHVSITDYDAEIMNGMTPRSGIYYVLAEEKDSKDSRKELFAKAKDLDLKVAKNISTEDLEKLINENE